jgi:hypothetical protein
MLPQSSGTEEDKSTWFTTDKQKYRVKAEERRIHIKSTHQSPHLVILSENLPKPSDTAIKVRLASPDPKVLIELDSADDEQCISKVVDKLWPATSDQLVIGDKDMQTFLCKISGNIIWSMWFSVGQEVSFSFKYDLIWPDGQQVYVS